MGAKRGDHQPLAVTSRPRWFHLLSRSPYAHFSCLPDGLRESPSTRRYRNLGIINRCFANVIWVFILSSVRSICCHPAVLFKHFRITSHRPPSDSSAEDSSNKVRSLFSNRKVAAKVAFAEFLFEGTL